MFENKDEGTIWDREEKRQAEQTHQLFEEKKKRGVGSFIFIVIILTIFLGSVSCMWMASEGKGLWMVVEPDEWAVIQSPTGEIRIVDEIGIHFKGLSSYWLYPRYISKTTDMISATFIEGKSRGITSLYRVSLPTGDRERADFHIWSGADNTVASRAVEAWITNCVKLEAPAFTGDEVWQNAAKRQEYYRLVKERVVSKLSPLKGLTITQFSITDIRLPADEAKAFQEKWVAEQMVIKAELELKVARAEAEAEVTMAKIKRDKQEALKELEKIPED